MDLSVKRFFFGFALAGLCARCSNQAWLLVRRDPGLCAEAAQGRFLRARRRRIRGVALNERIEFVSEMILVQPYFLDFERMNHAASKTTSRSAPNPSQGKWLSAAGAGCSVGGAAGASASAGTAVGSLVATSKGASGAGAAGIVPVTGCGFVATSFGGA